MNQTERECRQEARENHDAAAWRKLVEKWFIEQGRTGGTADDCLAHYQVKWPATTINSIAPRVHDLKVLDIPRLYATGEKRPTRQKSNATVYVHRTFYKPVEKTQQQSLFGGAAA